VVETPKFKENMKIVRPDSRAIAEALVIEAKSGGEL